MKVKSDGRASAADRQRWLRGPSNSSVEKKLSAAALSQQFPLRLMLWMAPAGEHVPEAAGGELAPTVRVKDQAWLRPAGRHCAAKRFSGQVRVEPVTEGPADYLAREQVEHHHQEDEPGGDRQVGRVRDPDAIRRRG